VQIALGNATAVVEGGLGGTVSFSENWCWRTQYESEGPGRERDGRGSSITSFLAEKVGGLQAWAGQNNNGDWGYLGRKGRSDEKEQMWLKDWRSLTKKTPEQVCPKKNSA